MHDTDLGIGLVGLGRWGSRLHARLGRVPGCRVRAVFDVDPAKLLKEAGCRCASFEALLDRAGVDAVVIATPSQWHQPMAIAALQAQKLVFVEKPMALSVKDAARLVRVARRGRGLMVGHVLQFHPGVALAQRLLHTGAIGELREMDLTRITRPVPHGGDALWELGPHDVAVARHMVGQDPSWVTALQRHELAVTRLHFQNGVDATITVGRDPALSVRRFTLQGSLGSLCFDEQDCMLTHHSVGGGAAPRVWRFQVDPPNDPLSLQLRHFVAAAMQRAAWKNDVLDGFAVVAVLDAASDSMRSNGCPMVPARAPDAIELDDYTLRAGTAGL